MNMVQACHQQGMHHSHGWACTISLGPCAWAARLGVYLKTHTALQSWFYVSLYMSSCRAMGAVGSRARAARPCSLSVCLQITIHLLWLLEVATLIFFPMQGYERFGFTRERSATVYREWAPAATAAQLIGDFNGWAGAPMQRDASGVWSVTLPDGASHVHRFIKAWRWFAVPETALRFWCFDRARMQCRMVLREGAAT